MTRTRTAARRRRVRRGLSAAERGLRRRLRRDASTVAGSADTAADRPDPVIPPGHCCRLRVVRTCSTEPTKRYNASCRTDPRHFNEWGPSPQWLDLLALQRGLR